MKFDQVKKVQTATQSNKGTKNQFKNKNISYVFCHKKLFSFFLYSNETD
jgi:hypothetical protein